jgi:hypothetical protein
MPRFVLSAHVSKRYDVTGFLSPVFSISALSSCAAIVLMFQANPWQNASQAGHVFGCQNLAIILWLHRNKALFTLFR